MYKTVMMLLGLSSVISHIISISSEVDSSHRMISHGIRKRSFIEPLFSSGNNIVKSVLGIAFPIETRDKVNFRTLVLSYNFQAQYMLVKPAQLPWQYLKRSLQNQKEYYLENNKTLEIDNTRQVVYNAVEMLMNRKGINGRECLQRAICENAQSPITVTGIFHDILNLFLTPKEKHIDSWYKEAMNAGGNHADCLELYKSCPVGSGIFDSFFQFIH